MAQGIIMATATPFDDIQQEQEDFEKILEENFNEQFDINRFSKGDMVEATVLDVTDREVYLDLGQKVEGICPLEEFSEKPAVGDKVKVIVIKGGGIEGSSIVSRREADKVEGWEKIKEAYQNNLPLSGKVILTLNNNKGYLVELNTLRLFLPKSQVGIKVKNRVPTLKVGNIIDFKVLSIDEKRKSAIISRKKIQEDINQEKWENFLSKYKEGQIVEGTISKIVSFGMFVRIDDLDGLVHQADISWKSGFPFRKYYRKGDKVSVKILSINPEENRISLGIKQLTENPWEWAAKELHPNDIITGTITDIKDYGAFLEIREGLEGLIHQSELSWGNKQVHPKSIFKKGQEVEVKVLSIDPQNKRIALSYKQARQNPWELAGKILKVGEVREGKITGVVKYGAFVEIFEDVEGLIHINDYSWDEKPNKDMLKKGDIVKFKILSIDIENKKISCGIKQLELSPYQKLAEKYKKGDIIKGKVTGIADFGIFVDIGDGFEGLVHKSKINLKKDETLSSKFRVGDEVTTVLLKIDPDKEKISLSIKDYEKRKEKEIVKQYLKDDSATYSLGSILQGENKDT